MRWGESVTLEFVKIYLKHECLWNPEHPCYKLKYEREKAYTAISSEFKKTAWKSLNTLEVKLKIKNLRTTYAQQVHKILEKSSPDSIYEPSLIWFNEMDRCLKNVSSSSRHSVNSSRENPPEVDSSCQIWLDQELPEETTEDTHPDPLVSLPVDHETPNTKEAISEKKHALKRSKKIKKKKSKHRNNICFADSNSECNVKESGNIEDEFDIYGKYIASQLRKIDLHKALRLQLQIQTLVSKARISDSD